MYDFETQYLKWRDFKLARATRTTDTLQPFHIKNPTSLTKHERQSLHEQCEINNFAIYQLQNTTIEDKYTIGMLAKQLGMLRLDQHLCADNDSISSLQVIPKERTKGYIPYTAKGLNWHTDGYYNPLHQHIRSFLLHCVKNAQTGGGNMLINHELIYIQLYDEDPSLVAALRQQDAFTIPANLENGSEVRGAQSGPVFYRDPSSNTLQMRYTARTKNIIWKRDSTLLRAVSRIEELLRDNTYILHYTLHPGEGLICNNILHGRSAFTNGNIPQQQRLLYRVRSFDRLFHQQ